MMLQLFFEAKFMVEKVCGTRSFLAADRSSKFNDIRSTAHPISTGANGFDPVPPKSSLPIRIEIKHPIITNH
ncbi:MAG: hypothetical protein SWJ54_21995, partial [Cyanobacteriota bacterium]|nr:hypothetical protein [Cyanobacteriota bacterium]